MRDWLQNLRKNKGLTQKEIGEKLGISESYYCSIEKGVRQKKMDMMVASGLSAVFGIPVSEIVQMEHEYSEAVQTSEEAG